MKKFILVSVLVCAGFFYYSNCIVNSETKKWEVVKEKAVNRFGTRNRYSSIQLVLEPKVKDGFAGGILISKNSPKEDMAIQFYFDRKSDLGKEIIKKIESYGELTTVYIEDGIEEINFDVLVSLFQGKGNIDIQFMTPPSDFIDILKRNPETRITVGGTVYKVNNKNFESMYDSIDKQNFE